MSDTALLTSTPYVGRFAPSPTGPLHIGSLVTALASWLDARAHGGTWHVRIEDVDTPRCDPHAIAWITQALQACGLYWDGDVWLQSQRSSAYQDAFDALQKQGLVYACGCTRKEIADSSIHQLSPHVTPVYPGTCRAGLGNKRARAWRAAVPRDSIRFVDRWQGPQAQALSLAVGDFVLRRADGLWAYQLAVVVDDAAQHITHVVRGADLLDSTPRQIWLQQQLGYRTPRYLHVPVMCNEAGEKLSKQTGATAINWQQPLPELRRAAQWLGLTGQGHNVTTLLHQAILEWRHRW